MEIKRRIWKTRLTEHISWAELLGLRERPDELRFDGGSWVAAGEGGADQPVAEVWETGWPTAIIVEVLPWASVLSRDERPTLVERPRARACAAI